MAAAGERAGARRGVAGSRSPGALSRARTEGRWHQGRGGGARARGRVGGGGPGSDPNTKAAPTHSSREEEVSEAGAAWGGSRGARGTAALSLDWGRGRRTREGQGLGAQGGTAGDS